MIIEEQTITDANTGVTLTFRRGLGVGVVEVSNGTDRHSTIHFTHEGEIISITADPWKELGLTSVRAPPTL
jgi:hypothetical protein